MSFKFWLVSIKLIGMGWLGKYYPQMDELFWKTTHQLKAWGFALGATTPHARLNAQRDPQITPIVTDYIRGFS
jgi:hypothetical protein